MATALAKLLASQRRRALGGNVSLRAFGAAAKDVAKADGNPFLRFSNPMPQNLDYTPLLSSLPETKVRRSVCNEAACTRSGGQNAQTEAFSSSRR